MFIYRLNRSFNPSISNASGKAQGLVERIALGGGYHIGSIEREDIHLETGSHREVLAVALALALVMITGTQGKLVIIYILGTYAIVDFLQLFLESAWGIAEALEDAADARNIVVFAMHTVFTSELSFPLLLSRNRRYEILVGISGDGKAVVLVDKESSVRHPDADW